MEKNYKLYVEQKDEWEAACSKDYFIDEPVTAQTVENGIILPLINQSERDFRTAFIGDCSIEGGVCDSDGNFVSGHVCDCNGTYSGILNINKSYPVEHELPYCAETVVYGGLLINLYGHMITDSFSRMWWFVENRNCGLKFVFLEHPLLKNNDFMVFFQLLGIPDENILILNEATRFASIIVPDQTMYLHNGYKEKAALVYNAIRDSVEPANKEKIYITRTKLNRKQIINEEFFENFYKSLGYDIVAIEKLAIKEQIAILAGAKDIVTSSGSSHLQVLFCQEGVNISILNRTSWAYWLPIECWTHKLKKARCTFIDVAINPLPTVWCNGGVQLFMPTAYWKQYINDNGYSYNEDNDMMSDDTRLEYLKTWAKAIPSANMLEWSWEEKNYTLADVIIGLNKLFSYELNEYTKRKLLMIFSSGESPTAVVSVMRNRIDFFNTLQEKVRDVL